MKVSRPRRARHARTALITGAARRIGRACAFALAGAGFRIVAHYRGSREDAESLARALRRSGSECLLVEGDLASPREAEALFERAVALAGPVDVLVNNASLYRESRLADVPLEEVQLNLNIHALSPLALARRFAAQDRPGLIVNLLDARVVRTASPQAAYHLSKQVLLLLTRMMAVEFAPRVRVNAIAPGAILAPVGKDAAYMRRLAAANPLQRTGSLEAVTRALLYLVDADFVTGQVLFVDGGYHLKGGLDA